MSADEAWAARAVATMLERVRLSVVAELLRRLTIAQNRPAR